MKKKMTLFLSGMMLLTALTGCGATGASSDAGAEAASSEEAKSSSGETLQMITWSNEGTVNALKELNEKFKEETGITVELTEVPSQDYESLLNTRLAANDVDIFCYTSDSRAFAQPVVDWAPTDQLTWESIITGGNALDLSGYDWI